MKLKKKLYYNDIFKNIIRCIFKTKEIFIGNPSLYLLLILYFDIIFLKRLNF